MPALLVPLGRQEFDKLVALSRTQRRRPQDQAAVMLERVVRRAVLPIAAEPPAAAKPRDGNDG